MWKSISALLLLACCFALTQAWLAHEMQAVAPGTPIQCAANGRTYKPGESWSDGKTCSRSDCSVSGSFSVLITTQGCSPMGFGPNCHQTPEDLSKPYPACCPQVKCS